ncbi:hypothetical protein Salat_1738100 [Sesamum alatum]|uniref:Myb/SANT-like domain-containing protein n=1 Tax=Sesamum alatum TaxID=300844 RepID=A0AAE1Y865_9LAMI|nr:hypothetical protein Salat_1738100 [Sesamum alatum]
MCPPQAHYFYNRYFNKDMDDVFIHTLVANHNEENGAPNNGPNVGAVCAAQRAVNGRFGKRLAYRYCIERVVHLRERHTTFSWLISREGVFWLPRWKQLWADEGVWDEIGRENPFALAYRWRPEPKWDELKALFGEPDNEGMTSSSENASLGSDSTLQATILDIQDYDAEVSSASSVPKSA